MSDKTPDQIKAAAKANMQRKCGTENCYGRRNSAFGKLCGSCNYKLRRYGTVHLPHDHTNNRKAYSKEIKAVTQLLSSDPHNTAVMAAKQFIADWLLAAQVAPDGFGEGRHMKVYVPARLPVRVLADRNVLPIEILICTAGCWLYMRHAKNKHRFDGHNKMTQYLGRAMIQAAGWSEKSDGRIDNKMASQAGQRLWQGLAKFYIHIELLLINQHREQQELKALIESDLPELPQFEPNRIERAKLKRNVELMCKTLGMSEDEATELLTKLDKGE